MTGARGSPRRTLRRARAGRARTPRLYAAGVPEGDTIHNAANRLRPALVGRALVRFDAPRLAGAKPRPGARVSEVEAHGKHLLISFDDGHLLLTHLRMTGRWDLYATGERWRKPSYLARVIIETDEHVAVCFSAPVVRLTRQGVGASMRAVPELASLGPDLCRPEADLDVALDRMAQLAAPETAIADVLLDQRIAAGVGNVFKSEVLWACRVYPLTPATAVDDDTRRQLLTTAARQLRASVAAPGRRTTVSGPPGSLAVYGRARRPCRRCGALIVVRRTGPNLRSTYWCPRCQPDPADAAPPT